MLKDNGIEIKDHRILEFTIEQEQYIINEYNNGKSSVDLGKEFKCSDNVIARLLNKNGITCSCWYFKSVLVLSSKFVY